MNDTPLTDLLQSAGAAMTQAANSLPEREWELLAEKMNQGARLELRVMTEPVRVSLWVHGPAGEAFEASVYAPPSH